LKIITLFSMVNNLIHDVILPNLSTIYKLNLSQAQVTQSIIEFNE